MSDYLGQLVARSTGASRSVGPRPVSLFEPPVLGAIQPERVPVADAHGPESAGQMPPAAPAAEMHHPPSQIPGPTAWPETLPKASPATPTLEPAVAPEPGRRPDAPAFAAMDTADLGPAQPSAPRPASPDGRGGSALPGSPPPRQVASPTRTASVPLPDSRSRAMAQRPGKASADSLPRGALDLIERLVAKSISKASPSPATSRRMDQPDSHEEMAGVSSQPPSLPSMVRQMVQQSAAPDSLRPPDQRPLPESTAGTAPMEAQAVAMAREIIRPRAVERPARRSSERLSAPPRLTPHSDPLFLPATSSPPPSIRVSIGRIEIRATTDAAAPEKQRPKPAVMSLEDYLAQRARGERR